MLNPTASAPSPHFEIYGEDLAKLAQFYASLFGWQIEKAPGVDYWRIQTQAKSGNGFDGGLTYRPTDGPHSWLHYVTVASVDAALAEAQRMGASIVRPKNSRSQNRLVCRPCGPAGKCLRHLAD
jgi:uncharacterized protein